MTPEQKAALQRAAIARAKSANKQDYDAQGFPITPEGGVSVNGEALREFQDKAHAATVGAMQGATLRLGDEFGGLRAGLMGQNPQPDGTHSMFDYSNSFGERYRAERDELRAMNQDAQAAEPKFYGAGEILGGAATSAASLPVAAGKTTLATAARGIGIGAGEGAIFEAAGADGAGNIPQRAARGAIMGGVAGGAAPGLVAAGGAAKNAVLDPATGLVDALMGRANKSKANRALMATVQKSGHDGPSLAKAMRDAKAQGQPDFRLMDALGDAGQRRASGLVRSGGDSSEELAEFLRQRQAGQPERVAQFVDEGFGMQGQTARENITKRTEARDDAADIAYDAARGNAAPVDMAGPITTIDQRLGHTQGREWASDSIDGKLRRFRNRLVDDGGDETTTLSNFDRVLGVKQEVQDAIGEAIRAGRKNEARELKNLQDALDSALEKASKMYRKANDDFATASRGIDAVDQGASMARLSQRAANNANAVQRMTDDQISGARVGYGDAVMAKIEGNSSPTANRAKVLGSPKSQADVDTLATDPALLKSRLGRENDMWETQNRALGGSRTADNLQDIEGVDDATSGLVGAGVSAMNLQLGDAVKKIASALGPLATGQTDQTRKKLVQALLASDAGKALAPAIKQELKTQMGRRMIEALMRSGGRVSQGDLTSP